MAKSGRRTRSAQMNGGGGGVSVSGCAPTGAFRARAFRLWLWRALPLILILLMLILILGSYLCSYPGITDSPKHSAHLLKDKVHVLVCISDWSLKYTIADTEMLNRLYALLHFRTSVLKIQYLQMQNTVLYPGQGHGDVSQEGHWMQNRNANPG